MKKKLIKNIIEYFGRYPLSEIEDYFKFIYQASFGPNHLGSNEATLEKIEEELKDTSISFTPYFILNDKYVRVDLSVLNNGFNKEKFVELFNKSFNEKTEKDIKLFNEYLNSLKYLVEKQVLEFDVNLFNNKLNEWKDSSYCPLHHSESYKKYYHPHYRVISKKLLIENGIEIIEKQVKKKIGDRKDARLIRDLDPMHFIVPLLYPNRCDNEAFISEIINLDSINKYLEKKNEGIEGIKYNLFQIIVTTMLKVIILRPKMNRFIVNKNVYQRDEYSASFVVKKSLTDDGDESLAYIRVKKDDTIDTIHAEIVRQINECRSDKMDQSSKSMDIFNKLPRWLSKFLVSIICRWDKKGKVPTSLIETDPYYSSVVLSHLGSIRLHASYHHLTNWGTNSLFVAVGEKKYRPIYDKEGNVTMIDSIDLGLTIDERIADGYYYSKTIRLIKHLLENPELLEKPLGEEVK